MDRATKIPHGIADFATIRKGGYLYADKTPYIREIEGLADYAICLRPHGFGRTLTLSTLKYYYDINAAESFNELFGGLYIGDYPTPNRNKYLILSLNLGQANDGLKNLRYNIDELFTIEMRRFCNEYSSHIPQDIKNKLVKNGTPASDKLVILADACHASGKQIYILIDNYDSVVEMVLNAGGKIDEKDSEIMKSMCYYFTFFESIKKAANSGVAKMFAVGVVPVLLHTLLTGFDIGTIYSTEPTISGLMGLSSTDLTGITDEPTLHEIEKACGGYCFASTATNTNTLINPDMAFSMLSNPSYPLNTKMSKVLRRLRDREYDTKTSCFKIPVGRHDMVMVGLEKVMPIYQLEESRYFMSLMYYYGMLSIEGSKWSQYMLRVPNTASRVELEGIFG